MPLYALEVCSRSPRRYQKEAGNFEVGFDLSRLYWKTGAHLASADLLDELELFSLRPQLVRVRRAHFAHYPNLSTAWRWLCAWAWGR